MVRHTGEDFIDVESVAVASVLSLQSACIDGSELDTPEADGFATNSDAPFSEKVFNIAVTVTTRLKLKRR